MNFQVSKLTWLSAAVISSAVAVGAVSQPACQTGPAPPQKTLSTVRTATIGLSGNTFGVAYARNQKDIAFVALDPNGEGEKRKRSNGVALAVLNTTALTPTLIDIIDLPYAYTQEVGANGVALTHDGNYLLVAAGQGAIIVDTACAAEGSSDAVVGGLNGTTRNQNAGNESVEVSISPDDKYVFISQEYGPAGMSGDNGTYTPGNMDIFRLNPPMKSGSVSGEALGYLSLGYAVVGSALSPNGRTLYATSELGNIKTMAGMLSVIDVPTLEKNVSYAAIRSNISIGCEPVRTIAASDGKTVWVTARSSNHLLAFDTAKLISRPEEALVASVQVGTSPVGLIFARNETRILTADSNRSNITGSVSGLSVVDVEAALAGKANANLGRIPTGLFPREFSSSPDGKRVLVSDHDSKQVQVIDVDSLP